MNYYDSEIPKKLEDFKEWQFSSGPTTGKDFEVFAGKFKDYVKKMLIRTGVSLVDWNKGHYYLSGFMEQNGKYVYFNVGDVRLPLLGKRWYQSILVRTAKNAKDYTGGTNNFCNLDDFAKTVFKFLK